MFVLTSAAPDALLRTVRSRTMRLAFGRLTSDDLVRLLGRDHGHTPDQARRAALLADGSAGAALALGSAELADARSVAIRLLSAAGAPDVMTRLGVAKSVVGKKDDVARGELLTVLRVALTLVRDLALIQAGGPSELLANGDMVDEIRRLGRILPPPVARRAFETLRAAIRNVDAPRFGGLKVVADWVAVEL
jgi:DNA polymerase-3 subunit delta'